MIFDLQLNSRQPLATKLLESAVRRGQLANAYLFAGRALDDKWLLAKQLACFLNCRRVFGEDRSLLVLSELPNRRSCLIENPTSPCQNCEWILSNEHPQAWLTLAGDKPGQKVPVEKARAMVGELGKTSRYFRIIVVPNAQQEIFHRPAANALLKSIEQPPPDCIFVLFADNSEAVLPTIVSRSQVILASQPAGMKLWTDSHAATTGDADAVKLEATLRAVRAKLVGDARRAWSGTAPPSLLKSVTSGADLLAELNQLMEDGAEPDALVDLIADSELEALRSKALQDCSTSDYLTALLELTEKTKLQMEHYVKAGTAFESFIYSLNNLRGKYQGETNLAKR